LPSRTDARADPSGVGAPDALLLLRCAIVGPSEEFAPTKEICVEERPNWETLNDAMDLI
jgi:hypothetical protein